MVRGGRRCLRARHRHPRGPEERTGAIPWLVGLTITAAYWFTASTSFANPAVAIARAFTPTFSGIRPLDVPAFIAAECIGALLALLLARWLFASHPEPAGEIR